MCDQSRNTWLCVHWQWNTGEWWQLNALQASPVVHLVTPPSCVSLSMNTQPSVPTIIYVGDVCMTLQGRNTIGLWEWEVRNLCRCFIHIHYQIGHTCLRVCYDVCMLTHLHRSYLWRDMIDLSWSMLNFTCFLNSFWKSLPVFKYVTIYIYIYIYGLSAPYTIKWHTKQYHNISRFRNIIVLHNWTMHHAGRFVSYST